MTHISLPRPKVLPPEPLTSLDATGLSFVMMRDILLKTMFRMNLTQISDIARIICLPVALTQELVDLARRERLLEATGTLHANSGSEMGYQLTEQGKARAQAALIQSEYIGALPVPLEAYKKQVTRQSIRDIALQKSDLDRAMGHLILPPALLANLGPAINSGRSVLFYGPPGNGKSAISSGIRSAMDDKIFVPRAIEYAGQIITLYDPTIHSAAEALLDDPTALRRTANRYDSRYVRCDRPTVITGGELSLNMLDLTFNPIARTYQASLQMKATGGIFIIDDLGRQAEPPQKLINRWIIPLEENRDILTLQSGEKFTVPFDTLVIFSTNFHPNKIFDGAALRRIFFKIKIDGPSQADFLDLFGRIAKAKGLEVPSAAMTYLLEAKYPQIGHTYANYQPGFLIDQMLAVCRYSDQPAVMSPALIDQAWGNMILQDEEIAA